MKYYYAIDGDDIGKSLEMFILNNDISSVISFSKDIKNSLTKIENFFKNNGAKSIFCAGDSILAYSENLIEIPDKLIFHNNLSFSIGIGNNPSLALLALKKAKGLGKKRIEKFIGNIK